MKKRPRYSIGTKFQALGHTWTLVSCGGGRYGLTVDGASRRLVFTMPCNELHADIENGKATVVR